jgi:hypothetical protein
MPTLARDGWELESAEDRHAGHPTQFEIPSREERTELRQGARVKLLFLIRDETDGMEGCERMWVTIDRVTGATYEGILESQPATTRALAPGDRIAFGPEHVAAILVPTNDPRHPQQAIAASVRARRIRQIVILIPLVPALIIVKFGDRIAGLVNAPPQALWLAGIVVLVFCVAFSVWNWRCPNCRASLGRSLNPTHCPKCGCSYTP